MFLQLNHQNLEVYKASLDFVFDCYHLTNSFPKEERFGMISQIRRAALSVHLNIAEGCSRRSPKERKRYFEISRGSMIEIDAALDVAINLKDLVLKDNNKIKVTMLKTFKLLSDRINATKKLYA